MKPVWLNPKFDDLPLLTVPGYQYPSYDGDMAELHELADRVLEALASKPGPCRRVTMLPNCAIYNQTVDFTWIQAQQILDYWPIHD